MKYSFLILALTARALAEADNGEQVQVKTVGVQPGTTIYHTGALTQVQTVPAGANEPPQSPRTITSPLSKQTFTSVREREKTIHPSKQGGNPPAAQQETTASVGQGSTMSTKVSAPQVSSSSKGDEQQQSQSESEQEQKESSQLQSETQKTGGGGGHPQTTATESQGSQETPQPGSSPEEESSSKTTAQESTTGRTSPQQETEAPSPSEGGGDGDDGDFDPYGGLHNGTDPLSSFDTGPEPTGPAVAAPIFPVVGDEDAEEVQVPQTIRDAAKNNANKHNRVENDTPFKNPLDGHLPVLNAGKSAPEKVPDSILVKVGKHNNDTDTKSQSNNDRSDAEAQTSASVTAPNNNFQASTTEGIEPSPSTLIDTTSMSLKVNDQKKHTSTPAAAASSNAPSVSISSAVSQQSAAPSQ